MPSDYSSGRPLPRKLDARAIEKLRRKRFRILVVDDSQPFRKALAFSLKRLIQASVDEAEDGTAAMEKIKQDSAFDLIVMDVAMPGPDGIETCKAIWGHRIDANIVLMSAHTENGERARALQIPFLDKPFDPEAIARILFESYIGGAE